MSITIGTSKNNERLVKEIKSDGTVLSEAPVKSILLKTVGPKTPEELKELFLSLDDNQAIIAGTHIIPGKETTSSRSAKNFTFRSPWLPFDRDYITQLDYKLDHHNKPTKELKPYIQVLADIDPQLNYVSYLLKNSASNIIHHSLDCPNYDLQNKDCDCERVNPNRMKLWVQFHPDNTTEDIVNYSKAMFKLAIIKGYHLHFLSKSERAYPTVLHRTVFDTSCFQTQAWSYEGIPITHPPYSHNTEFYTHTGPNGYVDATKLTITPEQELMYNRIILEAKAEHKDEIVEKLALLKQTIPEQDWDSIDRGQLTDDTILYTTVNGMESKVYVRDIIRAMVENNIEYLDSLRDIPFKDPLDPDYGDNKAKLYINSSLDVKLHSFAHGSHYFSIKPDIVYISTAMEYRDYITSYKTGGNNKKPKMDIARSYKYLKEIAHNFYSDDHMSIDVAAEDLKQLASLPIMRSTLQGMVSTAKTIDARKRREESTHPLASYSFLKEGSGKIIRYDQEEGLTFFTQQGAQAYMDNYSPHTTGVELYEEWITDPCRPDVTGFGLYPPGTKNKLNMWMGFNTSPAPSEPTMDDIKPFIDFLDIVTNSDDSGVEYIIHWLSDLIQNPLREGDARTGIIIESPIQGIGKTFFARLIKSFFTNTNALEVSKLSRIVGNFNIRLMPAVLLILNEVASDVYGMSPKAITNVFNDMMDNFVMEVEKKGIDSKVVPNRIHMLVTTNHPFIYKATNDRRWTVFYMSDRMRGNKEYYGSLRYWWDNQGGRELTFTYLMNFEYNKALITTSYKGKDTVRASIDSLWDMDAWLFWMISTLGAGETRFTSKELYKSYEDYLLEEGTEKPYLSQFKLTSRMKDKFGDDRGFIKKNNLYHIDRDTLRKQFSEVVLNAPEMDWADYVDMDTQGIEDTPLQENIDL